MLSLSPLSSLPRRCCQPSSVAVGSAVRLLALAVRVARAAAVRRAGSLVCAGHCFATIAALSPRRHRWIPLRHR
ncbi:hypothetical protein Scep_027598 [Stephania cephalantha]|uniref:Uncharacterized protein n=1 Tax=Stephania cephalantha TaxID=152367 RepID=A0AAP0HL89_9MAGN